MAIQWAESRHTDPKKAEAVDWLNEMGIIIPSEMPHPQSLRMSRVIALTAGLLFALAVGYEAVQWWL